LRWLLIFNHVSCFIAGTPTQPSARHRRSVRCEEGVVIQPAPDTAVRVLIVEDEPLIADYMSDVLGRTDVRVIGAAMTGSEAVRIAERERPDIALVDIGLLGGMDGWTVARKLYERFGTRPVFVTGDAGGEIDARAAALGGAGCLYKPFRAAELVDAVTRARRD
jgi:two-component system, response regulator PdtaR